MPSAEVYPSIFQVPRVALVHEIESLSTRATPVFGELEVHGVGVLSDTVTREVGVKRSIPLARRNDRGPDGSLFRPRYPRFGCSQGHGKSLTQS